MKIKIGRWILVTNEGNYIIDFKGEEINEREIAMCIEEQMYKTPNI